MENTSAQLAPTLLCYKKLPVWNRDGVPAMFQEKHNTKAGTWAKLTILAGEMDFLILDEAGNTVEKHQFSCDSNHHLSSHKSGIALLPAQMICNVSSVSTASQKIFTIKNII